jgi:hypothetical protein
MSKNNRGVESLEEIILSNMTCTSYASLKIYTSAITASKK